MTPQQKRTVQEQGLGPRFSPEVENAWAAVYGVLANSMKDVAFGVAAKAG